MGRQVTFQTFDQQKLDLMEILREAFTGTDLRVYPSSFGGFYVEFWPASNVGSVQPSGYYFWKDGLIRLHGVEAVFKSTLNLDWVKEALGG